MLPPTPFPKTQNILFLFFAFFMLFPHLASASPTHLNGKELLNHCEVALDVFDKNFGRIQTENEFLQGTKAGICEGYLMSINEIQSAAAHRKTCVPDNLIMLETIAGLAKYLKNHPEKQTLPASSLVIEFYEIYFNCTRR